MSVTLICLYDTQLHLIENIYIIYCYMIYKVIQFDFYLILYSEVRENQLEFIAYI